MQNEYILTNQLGGYSSSTFTKGNTRKYHGLLIVSDPDLRRKVVIGSLSEVITLKDAKVSLHTFNFRPNVTEPDGLKNLKKWQLKGREAWMEFSAKGITVTKEISLAQEHNSVIVRYRVINPEPIIFSIAPLITNRSIHGLKQFQDNFRFEIKRYLNNMEIRLTEHESISVKVLSFDPKNLLNVNYEMNSDQVVYNNFEYEVEAERGLNSFEDQIQAGQVSFALEPGENYMTLQFSYEDNMRSTLGRLNNSLKPLPDSAYHTKRGLPPLKEFKEFLLMRSNDFLIDNEYRKSLVAGYHWFNDWGRDTFISFKGLLLVTRKYDFAKKVLRFWASKIKNGLIPNEMAGPTYNSIDASLWFIISAYYYYLETKDLETLLSVADEINLIISEYMSGTDYGIQTTNKGLLTWDDDSVSLSWMDSNFEGSSLTGRKGYLIEVQLLWYNALKILEFFDKELGLTCITPKIKSTIKQLHKQINLDFWVPTLKYTYDFIHNRDKNESIRPNIIIGLSLPFKVFSKVRAINILETAEKELVTELGLRTLAKSDPAYVAHYQGNMVERDRAYHNGTIWPFLLGFYLKAKYSYLGKEAVPEIRKILSEFWDGIKKRELSYLPEIFDPTDLSPDGALSQAWNYALFLEVITDIEL